MCTEGYQLHSYTTLLKRSHCLLATLLDTDKPCLARNSQTTQPVAVCVEPAAAMLTLPQPCRRPHLVEQPVEACKRCTCCERTLQGVWHPADQREAHTSTKRCSHAAHGCDR